MTNNEGIREIFNNPMATLDEVKAGMAVNSVTNIDIANYINEKSEDAHYAILMLEENIYTHTKRNGW